MTPKFSRATFLKGGAAGIGLVALSACSSGAGITTANTTSAAIAGGGGAETVKRFAEIFSHPASVSVTSLFSLPEIGWQKAVVLPDWAGYTDDTLAMNSLVTFTAFSGQGELYISPAKGVTSFRLFINNQELDTSELTGGGVYKLDVGDYTVNGDNTVQLSNIQPSNLTVGLNIRYPIVIDGTPADVGLDTAVLSAIERLVQSDVNNGFPSAQIAIVKNGRLIYQNAWGTVNAYWQDGTPKTDSPAVTNDTLYDLASNTKMYAANYALQYLVTQGKADLDSRIVDLLGEEFADNAIDITYNGYENPGLETNKQWKRELTIRDILRHQAGFPADPQYHNDAFDQTTQKAAPGVPNVLYSGSDGSEATRAATLQSIFKTPLMYEPGTKTVYSDVDYMLLTFIIEKLTGQRLDVFLRQVFWEPLGLSHITYNPLKNGFTANDCAATELNGNTRDGAISFTGVRTATLQGQVHDEKAYYAMGGISGHAGLFANATDLARLASAMLTGGYGDCKFFSRNVMDTFTAPKKESAANWGLGWWREADDARCWYFGTQSSSSTFGHQGWTGTLTMIDPVENLVVVYLTNKINSPVTDKAANANKFNGNWYTSSTLGFVPQILYQGFSSRAGTVDNALTALLADMVNEKSKLVAKAAPTSASHPIVRAEYAVQEALIAHAQATYSPTAWSCAKDSLSLLDESRDADELAKLQNLVKGH